MLTIEELREEFPSIRIFQLRKVYSYLNRCLKAGKFQEDDHIAARNLAKQFLSSLNHPAHYAKVNDSWMNRETIEHPDFERIYQELFEETR